MAETGQTGRLSALPIPVRCACGEEFLVPDDLAGGVAKCPRCGVHVSVRSRQEEAAQMQWDVTAVAGVQRIGGWRRVVYQLLVATAGGLVVAAPGMYWQWYRHGDSIPESAFFWGLPWIIGFVVAWTLVGGFRLPRKGVSRFFSPGCVTVLVVTAVVSAAAVVVSGLVLAMLHSLL
jgi:hypothetical protein